MSRDDMTREEKKLARKQAKADARARKDAVRQAKKDAARMARAEKRARKGEPDAAIVPAAADGISFASVWEEAPAAGADGTVPVMGQAQVGASVPAGQMGAAETRSGAELASSGIVESSIGAAGATASPGPASGASLDAIAASVAQGMSDFAAEVERGADMAGEYHDDGYDDGYHDSYHDDRYDDGDDPIYGSGSRGGSLRKGITGAFERLRDRQEDEESWASTAGIEDRLPYIPQASAIEDGDMRAHQRTPMQPHGRDPFAFVPDASRMQQALMWEQARRAQAARAQAAQALAATRLPGVRGYVPSASPFISTAQQQMAQAAQAIQQAQAHQVQAAQMAQAQEAARMQAMLDEQAQKAAAYDAAVQAQEAVAMAQEVQVGLDAQQQGGDAASETVPQSSPAAAQVASYGIPSSPFSPSAQAPQPQQAPGTSQKDLQAGAALASFAFPPVAQQVPPGETVHSLDADYLDPSRPDSPRSASAPSPEGMSEGGSTGSAISNMSPSIYIEMEPTQDGSAAMMGAGAANATGAPGTASATGTAGAVFPVPQSNPIVGEGAGMAGGTDPLSDTVLGVPARAGAQQAVTQAQMQAQTQVPVQTQAPAQARFQAQEPYGQAAAPATQMAAGMPMPPMITGNAAAQIASVAPASAPIGDPRRAEAGVQDMPPYAGGGEDAGVAISRKEKRQARKAERRAAKEADKAERKAQKEQKRGAKRKKGAEAVESPIVSVDSGAQASPAIQVVPLTNPSRASRPTKRSRAGQAVKRTIAFALSCVLGITCAFVPIASALDTDWKDEGVDFDYWQTHLSVDGFGLIPSLFRALQLESLEPPDGYEPEFAQQMQDALASLYDTYIETSSERQAAVSQFSQTHPNVICVMNESLADLSSLAGMPDQYGGLANMSALDAIAKGKTSVSVYGGGTCNSEFEVLTGTSLGYVGAGIDPYAVYELQGIETVPKQFKEMGYGTCAIHPEAATNWRRDAIYPQIGIDEFLSAEAFTGAETVRGHVRDRETYAKVLSRIESESSPQFIFDLTMMGHGGYETGLIEASEGSEIDFSGTLDEGQSAQMNEYLASAAISDADLRELIDGLSALSEPCVLVFFGDHQPGISYWLQEGGTDAGADIATRQALYATDYLIWANYDIAQSAWENGTVKGASGATGAGNTGAGGTGAGDGKDGTGAAANDIEGAGNIGASVDAETRNQSGAGRTIYSGTMSPANLMGWAMTFMGAPLTSYERASYMSRWWVEANNVYGYLASDGKWHSMAEAQGVEDELYSRSGSGAGLASEVISIVDRAKEHGLPGTDATGGSESGVGTVAGSDVPDASNGMFKDDDWAVEDEGDLREASERDCAVIECAMEWITYLNFAERL